MAASTKCKRLDREELVEPFREGNVPGLSHAERLAHPFLDIGRNRQRHLRHRISGSKLQEKEDDEADEQQRRHAQEQASDRVGQHGWDRGGGAGRARPIIRVSFRSCTSRKCSTIRCPRRSA